MWIVTSFFRLHRRRMYNEVGLLPIPYTEMISMADGILGLTGSLRSLFFECIEEMDGAVLEILAEKQRKDLEELQKKQTKRPSRK